MVKRAEIDAHSEGAEEMCTGERCPGSTTCRAVDSPSPAAVEFFLHPPKFFFPLPNFLHPFIFSSPSSLPICYHVSRFSYHILTSRKNSSQIGSKSRKIRPFWVDRSPPLDRRSKCRPQAVDHSGRPLHHGRSTAAVDRPWRTVETTEVRT